MPRGVLEGYAIEEAPGLVSDAQVQVLERRFLEVLDSARSGDVDLFMRKDYSWHQTIWEFTGNEHLASNLRRIVLPLFTISLIRLRTASEFDLLADARSHLPLLEAIKSRDVAASRAVLEVALTEWLQKTKEWVFGKNGPAQEQVSTGIGIVSL